VNAAAGVHHLALLVRDLPLVEAFYRDVLGLAVQRRQGERSVWLDTGGGAFLALEKAPPGDTAGSDAGPRPGWHLVALRIGLGEREAWERRLAAAGVAIYDRTAFTLYVRDPEGNRVGLSHWPDEASG
jgi:catechol 2,3-dioxygenase-like lactoylglutathione lyase family enzyme